MRLVLTAEQRELGSAVRRFLTEQAPSARVRAVLDSGLGGSGYDLELWRRLATELGLLGLTVPEKLGGSGAGHVERSVLQQELGRALTPSPFLGSAVLATDVLLASDDQAAKEELLPGMVGGEQLAAVAVAEHGGRWDRAGGATRATQATRDGAAWVLDGTKTTVLAGDVADVLLVYARTDAGPGWFRLAADTDGVARTTLRTLDPTRRLARIRFDSAPATPLATADPPAVLDLVADQAGVALAAEQLGGLERVLEMTVDYAKVRVQFGRPIGSYQAVKHGCADVYSDLELGGSALRYAAWTADHAPDELPVAAALAQSYLGPAYFRAATTAVQYHGGIGYTWEHDAHLFYKRAKASELLFGPPSAHRARLADRLGI